MSIIPANCSTMFEFTEKLPLRRVIVPLNQFRPKCDCLKVSLESLTTHAFNPNIWESEASRSLNSRLVWSTESSGTARLQPPLLTLPIKKHQSLTRPQNYLAPLMLLLGKNRKQAKPKTIMSLKGERFLTNVTFVCPIMKKCSQGQKENIAKQTNKTIQEAEAGGSVSSRPT